MCLLYTFTGCQENSLLEDHEILPSQSTVQFYQDPVIKDSLYTKGSSDAEFDTLYVHWSPTVTEARKIEIRAQYSKVNAEFYLFNYIICLADNSVEKWIIAWNPSIPPKDRTSDPLANIPDEEGEVENDPSIIFAAYCP